MNVLYHFRTRGTGAEAVHIAGIARALQRLGYAVTFSSPTDANPLATAGSNPFAGKSRKGWLHRLADVMPHVFFELLEIGYNLPAYFRNRRLIRQIDPVFVYERHAFFLFSTAWLVKDRKLVLEVNELVGDLRVRSQPFFSALARWTDRKIFTRADLIVVVSGHLKRRIADLGIDSDKIMVLPNAVDEEDVRELADGRHVREQLGLNNTDLVLGFIGWFVPWHRLDALLGSFAQLLKQRPDSWLMLVGDGDLRDELTEVATKLGIADRIFWPGAVSHQQIPEYIDAMDICIVPESNAYRSPIKLFEYMAQGKAVVAPQLEPIERVLSHGEDGMMFPAGDFDGLSETLIALAADEAQREELGRKARERILAQHTWTHNARAVLDATGLAVAGDGSGN